MAHSNHPASLKLWLGIALVILLADQFTKVLIVGYFQHGDSQTMTSFFNLVRVHNSGAAFSFLASASGWQRWFFTGIGIFAAGFILYLLRRHADQTLFCFALSLVLGGAIGNVIDRVVHGHRGAPVVPDRHPVGTGATQPTTRPPKNRLSRRPP